jgi:DNA polymerase III sliding clamp (beta) subunit (PCNA family)
MSEIASLVRTEFLEALNKGRAALATKEMLPELTHFWFDGKTVTAYNDVIGIQVPYSTPFKGGFRGALLMGFMENSRAKEIKLTALDNDLVEAKAAGARLKLALLGPERNMWQFPEVPDSAFFKIGDDMLKVIDTHLISVSADTTVADQLGLTLQQADDEIDLYTTDSKSITWSAIKRPKGVSFQDRVTVPATFCEQLLKICAKGGMMHINADKNFVVAYNDKGVRLWSRLIEVRDPKDFRRIVSNEVPKGGVKAAFPMPQRLKLALERALVVLTGTKDQAITFIADGDILRLFTKNDTAECKDALDVDGVHPNVEARIDPTLVKRIADKAAHFRLTETALVIFCTGGEVHLISVLESK